MRPLLPLKFISLFNVNFAVFFVQPGTPYQTGKVNTNWVAHVTHTPMIYAWNLWCNAMQIVEGGFWRGGTLKEIFQEILWVSPLQFYILLREYSIDFRKRQLHFLMSWNKSFSQKMRRVWKFWNKIIFGTLDSRKCLLLDH